MSYIGQKPAERVLTSADISDAAITADKLASSSVTQPKVNSGVAGTGPAFSATYSGAFTIPNNTSTKAQFNNLTGGFNIGGYFDTSAGRFTPLVAGYYQVNACLNFPTIGSGYTSMSIYKNGSSTIISQNISYGYYPAPAASGVIYLNGTTDYIEVYGFQNSGGSLTACYAQYFNACLIRAA